MFINQSHKNLQSSAILLILLFGFQFGFTQKQVFGLSLSYGPDIPYNDLAQRYGTHLSFGLGLEYFTASNYGLSLEWRYMFGDNVKTDPYGHLRQVGGSIVGVDGQPADHFYTIVGDQLHLQFRKILSTKPSGWVIGGSLGILAYKTVLKDINRTIAQSFEPYSFYYDRLSRGLAFKQLLGYEFHSESGLINGSITLENSLGFAQFIRIDKQNMIGLRDHSLGLRARWLIPFFKGKQKDKVKYF
ncbi:MAG TPA: hypothetical protein PKD85_09290 [Saprospiraceae bacterium]|nr:hypothetical protein [Saprospiraceae bacterium]